MTARMVDSPRLPRLERAACTPDQLRTAHMIVSVLLDYPGERYDEALAAAAESAAGLPGVVRDDVLAFVAWARSTGARAVAEHYVDTFD